jgi:uncharacterized membrane protein
MTTETLILIMLFTSLTSLIVEKHLAWAAYITSVCIVILTALILSFVNLIPSAHEVYDFFSGTTLTVTVVLLILSLSIKNIILVPRSQMIAFIIGTIGTSIGGLLASIIAHKFDPSFDKDAISKMSAQLSSSYVGGLENAVAMKKALNIDKDHFVAAFATDNLLTSAWMIFCMLAVKPSLTNTSQSSGNIPQEDSQENIILSIICSLFFSFVSIKIGNTIHSFLGIFNPIIYTTTVALLLAQIPYARKHFKYSYVIGSFLFYPFFFSMGAISDPRAISKVGLISIIMPIVIVSVHGIIIFPISRALKIPFKDVAIASQSLIGGPGTALALAQAKNLKSDFPSAIILGTLGYAIGNYVGISLYHISLFILQRI